MFEFYTNNIRPLLLKPCYRKQPRENWFCYKEKLLILLPLKEVCQIHFRCFDTISLQKVHIYIEHYSESDASTVLRNGTE